MQVHLKTNDIFLKILINFNTIFISKYTYLSLQIAINYTVMPIFTTCFNYGKLYTFP